jgi:hypothetical protein
MPVESQTCKKPYTAPKLNKLTLEQASLLLIGHATCGDRGAKDLLEVIYPAFQSEGNDDVPSDDESGEFGSVTPKIPSLIRRIFAALGCTRANFDRLLRG